MGFVCIFSFKEEKGGVGGGLNQAQTTLRQEG